MQSSLNSTASITNGLETKVLGLPATQQHADGDFSSVTSAAQNSFLSSAQCGYPRRKASMGSDNYNTLNHTQKTDVVFQITASTALTTSDYSLLQEGRYQSTSLLGSQSDQRYNHINRATSRNALTIIAPTVPDGNNSSDHSNQTYSHLTFDSDSGVEHSNSDGPGKGRAWSAANPCAMQESSLTGDPGRAFANCTPQSVGEIQYKTAFNPIYEHIGESEIYESRKIKGIDAGLSEPANCNPAELTWHHHLTGPAVAPAGVCSHTVLSEKQSTTDEDVPLVKSETLPTEESKMFGEVPLLLAQRTHLGAYDHVYNTPEQQGR